MKKRVYRTAAVFGLISMSLLTGCGEESSSKKSVKEEEQTMKKEKTVEQNVTDQNDKKVSQIKQMLEQGLQGGANIEYDSAKKQFDVIMTDSRLTDSLNNIKEDPTNEKWPKLIKAFKKLSKQIKSGLDSGYTIRLADPADETKTMLTILDGKVTYDFSAK
ncbi:hypothetical protein ACRW9N_09385 [Listeria aquatica]|uniref:hypothetical protein n=1 Tax=Listeria aquatica TaxID=1494960 RepID=UPI003EF289B2